MNVILCDRRGGLMDRSLIGILIIFGFVILINIIGWIGRR